MYEITYSTNGKQRSTRVPINRVRRTGDADATDTSVELEALPIVEAITAAPHPTEFIAHEPIAAVYRKGKKEIDVMIVATRNDGKLYKINGNVGPDGAAGTIGLPIEKVMIVNPEPAAAIPVTLSAPEIVAAAKAAMQQEPAAEGSDWERKLVEVGSLKGSGESPSQITRRHNNQHEREIRDKMLLGQWYFDRSGSEPRLYWDGTEHHTGDGHHTIQALQVAIDWLSDAVAAGLPGGTEEAIVERFNAGLIELPSEIPCYVKSGTATQAHTYSLREANRFHGLKMTPEQKRAGAWDTITDRSMMAEVVMWICQRAGKDFAKFADSIPADRAIAEWLDNVSAPTVADVWAEAIEADEKRDDIQWPWLNADKRIGLDGKLQKVKVKEAAAPPQVKPVAPKPEVDPIGDDAVDRSGNSVGGKAADTAGGTPGGTDPAPTNSAPVTPGQTYSGKARLVRIEELAKATADRLLQTIAVEMKTSRSATETYESLGAAIRQELEYHVTGVEF
jgi:hypothetical protein